MEIGKTIYIKDRGKWREWLTKNHDKKKDIWLIYYKKASGKPRIPYDDAVEEALCYGWIDSIVKNMNEEKFVQRFSPRRKTSVLSEMNRERIYKMIKEKKMTEFGLKAVAHVFNKNKKHKFTIPLDILDKLRENKEAWKNFKKFPEHYKKIRISYIERLRGRSSGQFKERLEYFIKMSEKNKRFGMMK